MNKNLLKAKRDSLLNEITNINKHLKNYISKDRNAGYSAPLRFKQGLNLYSSTLDNTEVRDANGLLTVNREWEIFGDNISFSDTIIFEPAYLPIVFDGKILPDNLDFTTTTPPNVIGSGFHLISPDSTFAPQLVRASEIRDMRRNYYMNNFDRIQLNALNFRNNPVIKEQLVEKRNPFHELLSIDNPVEMTAPEIEKYEIKKVYWIIKGEHSLQINQNSLSENWFTGGNNNLNVLNYHRFDINYKKRKISFSNILEWKLNFQNNQADQMHRISVMEDFVRTYSVLGIEAYKKWSYTANLLMSTPLFNAYPINSETKRAALFSPLVINTGIGMRYNLENVAKHDKYRKLSWVVDMSPLSVNYTYVGDKEVDETRFGVEEGKKSNTDFGMTVIMNTSYGFNRFMNINSRFKYFTNYQKALMEFENRFNLTLNKYLSTSVYLYLRFDDAVSERDPNIGYFQYNQILGFGLNYKW